jgi:CRP-like cAMP-binding protein
MDSIECLWPSYNELTSEQVDKIQKNSFQVKHKKGEQIFRQNQPVSHIMLMCSGLVKLYKEVDQEKIIILKIVGPGNFIGIISAFYGSRYQHSATALEDTETLYVNLQDLKEIIGLNGKYALHLLKQLSSEGILLIDKMINLSQKQIPGRIAEILLFFRGKSITAMILACPCPARNLLTWFHPPRKVSVAHSLNLRTTG